MTLMEFFDTVGGRYEDAVGRMLTEARVLKYLRKFSLTDDSEALVAAFREKRYADAFALAHTIKGVCLNLSLDSLGNAAGDLCETVRNGAIPENCPDELIDRFVRINRLVRENIAKLDFPEQI